MDWNATTQTIVNVFAIIGGFYACARVISNGIRRYRKTRLSAAAKRLLREIDAEPLATRGLTIARATGGFGFYVPRIWNGTGDGAPPQATQTINQTCATVAELCQKGRLEILHEHGSLRQYRRIR